MEERENSAKEKVESLLEPTEEEMAQKRVKVAMDKKQQKHKKQQDKQAKQLVKQEKQKNAQEKKQQRKLKKIEQKKKNQAELEMFRAEKLKLKREKQLQKAQIKQQKLQNKAQAKADKRAKRERRRSQRSAKGIGGWIAAVVTLSLSTLIFATMLVVNSYGGLKEFPQNFMSHSYSQCYEEFAEYSQNIDTNLSKFFVSNSKVEQQKLLIKVSEDSLLAEDNLQRLPIDSQYIYSTTKVVNQIGDYAKYLNNKLIEGLKLTKEDKENLYRLFEYNKNILDGLNKISVEIKNGAKIENVFKEKNVGGEVFAKLEDMAVSYPQLIYDGPFSDGLRNREVKGLCGEEITSKNAEKIFKSVFANYNLNQHEVVGEKNGLFKCYTLNAKDEFGNDVYAEISACGGKVISFNYQRVCEEKPEKLSQEDCNSIGEKFLEELGIRNMKAVWYEENSNIITINYAYVQNGVIVYPDLVKVNICKNSGTVFALEATNYYLNHEKREIKNAKISEEQALEMVSQDLNVQEVRLALIPKGNNKEVLTYEISGESEQGYYFIYINAFTGQEEQIFKVVETEQGQLLI